ncbi:CotJB protein [compost metagenome]
MHKSKKSDADQLLEELQAIDFALVDITLYLDTHPDDTIAFAQHLQSQAREIFERVVWRCRR